MISQVQINVTSTLQGEERDRARRKQRDGESVLPRSLSSSSTRRAPFYILPLHIRARLHANQRANFAVDDSLRWPWIPLDFLQTKRTETSQIDNEQQRNRVTVVVVVVVHKENLYACSLTSNPCVCCTLRSFSSSHRFYIIDIQLFLIDAKPPCFFLLPGSRLLYRLPHSFAPFAGTSTISRLRFVFSVNFP